jgi:hypothetical protein
MLLKSTELAIHLVPLCACCSVNRVFLLRYFSGLNQNQHRQVFLSFREAPLANLRVEIQLFNLAGFVVPRRHENDHVLSWHSTMVLKSFVQTFSSFLSMVAVVFVPVLLEQRSTSRVEIQSEFSFVLSIQPEIKLGYQRPCERNSNDYAYFAETQRYRSSRPIVASAT